MLALATGQRPSLSQPSHPLARRGVLPGWLGSDSIDHSHRSAAEGQGGLGPTAGPRHSEVWSYIQVGGSDPVELLQTGPSLNTSTHLMRRDSTELAASRLATATGREGPTGSEEDRLAARNATQQRVDTFS